MKVATYMHEPITAGGDFNKVIISQLHYHLCYCSPIGVTVCKVGPLISGPRKGQMKEIKLHLQSVDQEGIIWQNPFLTQSQKAENMFEGIWIAINEDSIISWFFHNFMSSRKHDSKH